MANRSKRTKRNVDKFLKALDQGKGNVSEACEAIGIGRTAAYEWRKDDDDFATQWNDVVDKHTDALVSKVYERAFDGWQEPVFYQGDECGTVTKFSDSNAQFLLKARRPNEYRENHKIELGGPNDGPIRLEVVFVETPTEGK